MRLDPVECARRFASARVARLATVGTSGRPHLVPVTFALHGDAVVFVIDAKPKTTTTGLRRLRNISANPHVSFLVDHYDDDWSQLWWVRADGEATILTGSDRDGPLVALREKYAQYVAAPPPGPVVRTDVTVWRGWAAEPAGQPS